jgi:adenylate kinase
MDCIVFFGIQGSGKGTQATLLSEALGYCHINIGDLFRDNAARGTDIGKQVEEVIRRGELVSDELVFEVIRQSTSEGCKGIVFDGFPRTPNQAEYLSAHYRVIQAFFLELSESTAIARVSARRVCVSCGENYNLKTMPPKLENVCDQCGGVLSIRQDDRPEAIAKRLKEFYEQTLSLREFFRDQKLLTVIPADNGIDEIATAILARVKELV